MSVAHTSAAALKRKLITRLHAYPAAYRRLRRLYWWLGDRLWPLHVEIARALKDLDRAYFVQVGSNDGAQNDPIHRLILDNPGWRGIFIEPVPFLFEKLKANYRAEQELHARFVFENVAIAEKAGEAAFYCVSEDAKKALGERLPFWYDQLGSFDRQHIVKHLDGLLEPFIVELQLPCLPIGEVLTRQGIERVDLLHIDTEGYDYNVLKQFDFARYQPRVVLYEHKHLGRERRTAAAQLMQAAGYRLHPRIDDTLAIRINP